MFSTVVCSSKAAHGSRGGKLLNRKLFISFICGLLGISLLTLSSCEEGRFGKPLVKDGFQFPTGIAVHPAGFAFVASANFDVAYVQGAMRVIDLNALAADLAIPVEQRQDYPYYRDTILESKGIAMGNFAGTVALSPDGSLLAVTIRENDELLLFDVNVEVVDGHAELGLTCWDGLAGSEEFPECEGARHRIQMTQHDPYDILFTEIEKPNGDIDRTAWISFLKSGDVMALDVPVDRDKVPQVLYSLETEVSGASDLAQCPDTGFIYVTSRFPAAQSNPVSFFDPSLGSDAEMKSVDLFDDFLGNETRSIAFSSDGKTAGLVVRNPDMLVTMDTSLDYTGEPKNTFLGTIGLGPNPSRVRALGDLFFITGAKDDAIDLVDGATRRLVGVREDVCRGPFEVAFWDRGDLKWALVSCFEDDTIAVMDVDSKSPTYLDVIARVGKPREGD